MSNKKSSVNWNIQQSKATLEGNRTQKPHSNHDESVSDRYIYSDTFEEQSPLQIYSDTFVSDSYSDTFVNTSNDSDKNGCTTDIRTIISLRTSADASEVQEASNLETAGTEMLETVIEVESDISYTEGITGTLKTCYEVDTTKDISHNFSDSRPTDSHTYSDTFESSERTKTESQYAVTPDSSSDRSCYSDSSRTYTDYYQGDESLLDRSYIAPDYDGKSLTDDEDDYADTYNNDYSYTFEPTESSTYVPHDPEQARFEAEQINIGRQAEKDFVKSLVAKLKSKPEKKFTELETRPADAEDDYLKHYCRKKMKLLKRKPCTSIGVEEDEDRQGPVWSAYMHYELSDYGIPESTLERAKITNIMSAMRRAAEEDIHDPSRCQQCREVKSRLDMEDSQRQFVTAYAKRLKNQVMDAKVEEHLLKMNSISMIGELARELPRPSEKPEKIFDKLFEPLLGKNVMR